MIIQKSSGNVLLFLIDVVATGLINKSLKNTTEIKQTQYFERICTRVAQTYLIFQVRHYNFFLPEKCGLFLLNSFSFYFHKKKLISSKHFFKMKCKNL